MTFSWPRRGSLPALSAALATRGKVEAEGRRTLARTYLDTFDGRLYRAGWTLALCDEPGLGLFLEGREPEGDLRCRARALREPRFAADLPPGGLAEVLAGRIAPRRLLPQATIEVRADRFRCLDEREKTVARIAVERRRVRFPGSSETQALPSRLVVEPVRGFEDAAGNFAAACGELGLEPAGADELSEVLAKVGRLPGHDPARIDLALDSRQSAGEALVTVHSALLAVIRATEDGVRHELDPEFLHDYRVALRRTRSTLGQLREVYAEEPTERFRDELGRLARETGPARDLDVFHEEIAAEAEADPDLGPPLAPLLEFVARERRRAGRRLARVLEGPRAARTLADWERFLAAPAWGPAAPRPPRAVFGEALARARERLLRRGAKLDPTSPPDDFHRLRIDAKKLRYVLETGASLYPAELVSARLAPLKALQELLGEAQDLAVREARLADAAVEIHATAGPATLVALGRLVERAHRRRYELYGEFAGRFEEFAAPAEQKRWLRLLRASR